MPFCLFGMEGLAIWDGLIEEIYKLLLTKDLAHHADKLQGPGVAHPVEHAICIFAGCQDSFITQYGQVLGDVALRRPDILHDILHAYFLISQGT